MEKRNRLIFGITGKPVECNIVLRKEMNFDHEEMERGAFILINTTSQPARQTSANLYGGKAAKEAEVELAAGKNYDPMTYPITDWAKVTKKWEDKGYVQVPMSQCPLATLPMGVVEGKYDEILKSDAAKEKAKSTAEAK